MRRSPCAIVAFAFVAFAFISCFAPHASWATPEVPVGGLTVFFDIRPEQCPNRLISGGFPFGPPTVPTAVLGTGDVDVSNIQVSSILLIVPGGGGYGNITIPPLETGTADVATPVDDPSGCNCTDDGPDVQLDLTALFDQDAILNALQLVNPDNVEPVIDLCITGNLLDGTPFAGCDCVVVDIIPLATEPSTWGRVKSGYR